MEIGDLSSPEPNTEPSNFRIYAVHISRFYLLYNFRYASLVYGFENLIHHFRETKFSIFASIIGFPFSDVFL